MNTDPILSILTPTIPGREKQLAALQAEIEKQAGDLPVEHLCLCDNKKRSIGAKRQALVDIARGHYIAFVDDDDKVRPAYIHSLVAAMKSSPDVITFEQDSTYNKLKSKVVFKLGQGDGPYTPDGITQRTHGTSARGSVLECLIAYLGSPTTVRTGIGACRPGRKPGIASTSQKCCRNTTTAQRPRQHQRVQRIDKGSSIEP
jgi:hypothetical protein